VPVRQWVLTVPFSLRFGMAFDPALAGVVLRIFVGVVSRWLRRRARAHRIRGALKTGVTVIQRFGSALNLNVHFHRLMIDGVYQLAGHLHESIGGSIERAVLAESSPLSHSRHTVALHTSEVLRELERANLEPFPCVLPRLGSPDPERVYISRRWCRRGSCA
jgi:hypothetical protein